jgi:DNA-binding response OmpR family regulator
MMVLPSPYHYLWRREMRALLIEDSPEAINTVSMAFEFRWPEATIISAVDGAKGIEMAEAESPDIIILEIKLPDVDGFEVLRQIRLFSDVPVIILSVRDAELDRVRGLEGGADDYIVKPFSVLDFLARVKSALRRSGRYYSEENVPPFVSTDLTIDFQSKEILLRGKPVQLTPTEGHLLCHLVRNEGRFISYQNLEQKLYGRSGNVDPSTIRRYVYQLRAKLEDCPPRLILSHKGTGYKFVRPK